MAYEARALRRQKVRYNSDNDDNPLVWSMVDGDGKYLITSSDTCAISIYASGSTTALVSAAAATVSIGSSLISYAVDTTTVASWPVGEGYRADITITHDGGVGGTDTYDYGHILFDIVKYVPQLLITRDQLVDRDPLVASMAHAGDEEFLGPIMATRDDAQILIEALATDSGQVLEDMVLDHHKLASVFVYRVLERIFRGARDFDMADYYASQFEVYWKQLRAQLKPDSTQSGSEDSTVARYQRVRFTT